MAGVADKASSLRVAILDSFDEAHEGKLMPIEIAILRLTSVSAQKYWLHSFMLSHPSRPSH